MTLYNKPILGKFGIRSACSKRMAFGICADTKKECFDELKNHIGYYDTLKYRWFASPWYEDDIKEQENFEQEMIEFKENQKKERIEKKEKAKFIKNNLDNLKDEYIEKFKKSFLSYDGAYRNIREAYTVLKQWLSMTNRVKELKQDD